MLSPASGRRVSLVHRVRLEAGGRIRVSVEIIQRAGYTLAALLDHMRVNHRGGHVGMPQQFLDGADVRAPLQEVRRKAVPERVRADHFGMLSGLRRSLEPA